MKARRQVAWIVKAAIFEIAAMVAMFIVRTRSSKPGSSAHLRAVHFRDKHSQSRRPLETTDIARKPNFIAEDFYDS